MKKYLYILFVTVWMLSIFLYSPVSHSETLADKVRTTSLTSRFIPVDLFTNFRSISEVSGMNSYLTEGTVFTIRDEKLKEIHRTKPENIILMIPGTGSVLTELVLMKSEVLTNDFKTVELSSGGTTKETVYEPGVYYRGIVKGKNRSWAAVSIFKDHMMAIFADENGNYNISPLNIDDRKSANDYIVFNEADLLRENNFTCYTNDETMIKNPFQQSSALNETESLHQYPIKKYFECDYKLYQTLGSSTVNVNNYVTSVYNAVIALYQNEQIVTQLQSTYIWTTTDIYTNTNDLFLILKRFGARVKDTFSGHLAHFLSNRTNIGGGIAWIDFLCWPYYVGDSSGRYAVSVIDTTVKPFPVYSWTVANIAHEMGHNVGSIHTHNCSWPGGPIDTCYAVEGGCYSGAPRPRAGTIMSYCHANGSINFSLGFGPLPGNLMRTKYQQAMCLIGITQLGTSVPAEFVLEQNYPNPFNPSTNIVFSIPVTGDGRSSEVELSVYDLLGRKTGELVKEKLSPGKYSVDFNASELPSGVYFYVLKAGDFTMSRKMILVK